MVLTLGQELLKDDRELVESVLELLKNDQELVVNDPDRPL